MKKCLLCGSKNKNLAKACLNCSHPFGASQAKSRGDNRPYPDDPVVKKAFEEISKDSGVRNSIEAAKKMFSEVRNQADADPPSKLFLPPEVNKLRSVFRGYCITTPAGPPPCKPAHGPSASDDEIKEWANAILTRREMGMEYAPSAVKYFAKTFWAGDAYRHACELIDEVHNLILGGC